MSQNVPFQLLPRVHVSGTDGPRCCETITTICVQNVFISASRSLYSLIYYGFKGGKLSPGLQIGDNH